MQHQRCIICIFYKFVKCTRSPAYTTNSAGLMPDLCTMQWFMESQSDIRPLETTACTLCDKKLIIHLRLICGRARCWSFLKTSWWLIVSKQRCNQKIYSGALSPWWTWKCESIMGVWEHSLERCWIGNAVASGGLKWQYIAIIATFSSYDEQLQCTVRTLLNM